MHNDDQKCIMEWKRMQCQSIACTKSNKMPIRAFYQICGVHYACVWVNQTICIMQTCPKYMQKYTTQKHISTIQLHY